MSGTEPNFDHVIAAVGGLMSLGAGIGLAWRKRTRWEPPEEELPSAPQKYGALSAAVLSGLAYIQLTRSDLFAARLPALAVATLVVTGIGLLAYSLFLTV